MVEITKTLVGEALVGEGNEVAHLDLLIGPRGSSAEQAFCTALVSQRDGITGLLVVAAPNLVCRPNTVMINKVAIRTAKQALQFFGPVQRGIARAIVECVKDGVIPLEEADDLFLSVGVFLHWEAEDDSKIERFNHEAMNLALRRVVRAQPTAWQMLEALEALEKGETPDDPPPETPETVNPPDDPPHPSP